MKAVFISQFGGPENLEIREVADPPKPSSGEILIRVRAAGLNRADLLQRRGLYPPPTGYSPEIPGLEFAGEVEEIDPEVESFAVGDRVFGITAGEAHAEYLTLPAGLVAAIPDNLSFAEAAAVPEVFITAHDACFSHAGLKPGETLLVHAVGSGVGLAALQLGKAFGSRVVGTSRTAAKLEKCKEFGLDRGIATGDAGTFADEVLEFTGGRGADVILDLVGASYFSENLKALAPRGRLMLVGLTGGRKAEFDLGVALTKRAVIRGTVLRSRTVEEKAAAVADFSREVVPLLAERAVRANLDRLFNFREVADAHKYLESNESFGKVVLEW